MFGKNPIERQTHDEGLELDVVDVFETIQGEGPFAGRAAIFVRLAGCHLRCHFCDTDFLTHRRKLSIKELMLQTRKQNLIVLTGGEPMRQNIVPFLSEVVEHTLRDVQIETAGHFWPDDPYDQTLEAMVISGDVSIVVSPKTAAVHHLVQRHAIAWKYIITHDGQLDPEDLLPMTSTQDPQHIQRLARPKYLGDRVYVQPCDHNDECLNSIARARCVDICLQRGYRLSLQQHKILGLP